MQTQSGKVVQLSPEEFPLSICTAVATEYGSLIKEYKILRQPNGSIRIQLLKKTLDKKYEKK